MLSLVREDRDGRSSSVPVVSPEAWGRLPADGITAESI